LVNQVNGFRNVIGISNLVVNQVALNTPPDSFNYNVVEITGDNVMGAGK